MPRKDTNQSATFVVPKGLVLKSSKAILASKTTPNYIRDSLLASIQTARIKPARIKSTNKEASFVLDDQTISVKVIKTKNKGWKKHRSPRRFGVTVVNNNHKSKPKIPEVIIEEVSKTEEEIKDNNITKEEIKDNKTSKTKEEIDVKEESGGWDDIFASINEIANNVSDDEDEEELMLIIDLNTTPDPEVKRYITGGSIMKFEDPDTKYDSDSDDDLTKCKNCGGELRRGRELVCTNCGAEGHMNIQFDSDSYSTAAIDGCNVKKEGFLAHKFIGPGSYGSQKSMLKTCSNYSTYSTARTLREIQKKNSHAVKSHLPKNIIIEANQMFATIRQHGHVFRKNIKLGIISACAYYACYRNGISKTPSEIAKIFEIEDKFHSAGDRTLQTMNELGVVSLPNKINPTEQHVIKYMTKFGLDMKYRPFVLGLISTAERYHIHIIHDNKYKTKAVGAIYMLIERIPEYRKRITKEQIAAECSISATTFLKYYKVLCKYYRKFPNVFKRNKIPMKIEWREE